MPRGKKKIKVLEKPRYSLLTFIGEDGRELRIENVDGTFSSIKIKDNDYLVSLIEVLEQIRDSV